ncbi:hypothetical protein [Halobacteriovorax sp. JY17]|uniref:hypothetical protein n=1 Tax=Halobacteriovorax sp. JY17 TaxID=2014617 RepID=UPI000C59F94D|nr:hypothetical protein [Halobacteriovorax sp. JY17]PIK16469.1 MAG: hypothetical protein CES88_06940 [Halobacteriovorax sp. JY17]
MPSSKWFPWDFLKSNQTIINSSKPGLYIFQFCDEFISHILLATMPRELTESGDYFKINASDITIDWLEEKFKTISLFGNNESYLVIEAQNLPANTKKWLEENPLEISNQFLILSFSKPSKNFEQLSKKMEAEFIRIDAPRFWEGLQHLEFICNYFKLSLPMNVKNYLLTALENTSYEFFQAINLISLYFPGGNDIKLEYIQKLIRPSKLDHFQLANLFCTKKRSHFFGMVSSKEIDFEQLRSLFNFMQGHLFKMMDTSYCDGKSRLSKYDREILSHAKAWTTDELQRESHLFGELEIDAKSKSALLKNKLRLEYLSSF